MANPFSFGRYRSSIKTNENQSNGPNPIVLQTEQEESNVELLMDIEQSKISNANS